MREGSILCQTKYQGRGDSVCGLQRWWVLRVSHRTFWCGMMSCMTWNLKLVWSGLLYALPNDREWLCTLAEPPMFSVAELVYSTDGDIDYRISLMEKGGGVRQLICILLGWLPQAERPAHCTICTRFFLVLRPNRSVYDKVHPQPGLLLQPHVQWRWI